VRTSSVRPPLPPTHPSAASSFIPMRRLLRHRFQCSAMSVFWCPPISPPFSPHSSCFQCSAISVFWFPQISPPFSPHSSSFRPHHVPSSHCHAHYSFAFSCTKITLNRFPCILSRQFAPRTDWGG